MRNPLVATLLVTIVAFWTALAPSSAAPITFRDLLARPRATPTKIVTYGPAPHQFAELWLPEGPGPHRTLVMIHGGCWLADLPGTELMAYLSEDLRQHGYAVWNIDYRRIGDEGGGYPGTFLDTAAAIDKLRDVALTYNLDLKKLVAIGHSAGGHLAVWAAARRNIPKPSPLFKADPVPIAGVVSLAGIIDLEEYRAHGPTACGGTSTIDALVGLKGRLGQRPYVDTSPVELLPIGARLVVVAGTADPIVPLDYIKAYTQKIATSDPDTLISIYSGAGHFELIDPRSREWDSIRAEIDELMK